MTMLNDMKARAQTWSLARYLLPATLCLMIIEPWLWRALPSATIIGWLAVLCGTTLLVPRLAPLSWALIAYVGGAGAAFHYVLFSISIAVVLLRLVTERTQHRSTATTTAVALVLTCLLVQSVLWRGHWTEAALRFGSLAYGLFLGIGAFFTVRLASDTSVLRKRHVMVVAGLLLTLAAIRLSTGAEPTLPAWSRAKGLLQGPQEQGVNLQTLERLRAAGFRDATYAWIAIGLDQGLPLPSLQRHCKHQGYLTALDDVPAWQPLIQRGELACHAVERYPEAGATLLTDSKEWTLLRVAFDLWLEAGLVDRAQASYARMLEASGQHEVIAARHAVFTLAARNRLEQAASLLSPTAAQDPQVQLLTHPNVASESAWHAWNQLMDFSDLGAESLHAIEPKGFPATLSSVYEPALHRRTLRVLSKHPLSTTLTVRPTPGFQTPTALTVKVKNSGYLELILRNNQGDTLRYSCDAASQHERIKSVRFPDEVCEAKWSEVTLHPRELLEGQLADMELRGDPALAYLKATP